MTYGSGHPEFDRGHRLIADHFVAHRFAAASLPTHAVAVAVSDPLAAVLLAVSLGPGAVCCSGRISAAHSVSRIASLVSARSFGPAVAVWQTAVPAFAEFLAFQPASALLVAVFLFLVPAADTQCPRE